MRVAVTGGTGFVGGRIVKTLLNNGYSVNILTRQADEIYKSESVRYFRGDLKNIDVLSEFLRGCDVVCNCAGEFINESLMKDINYNSTKILYGLAVKSHVKRFIQMSSVGVYGFDNVGVIDESACTVAQNTYEKSKILADEWLLKQKEITEVFILRPSIIFGEEMKNNSLRQLVNVVTENRFFFIGKKTAVANYVYIQDVANITMALCNLENKFKSRIYNLSDSLEMREFIRIICSLTGTKFPDVYIPKIVAVFITLIGGGIAPLLGRRFPLTISRIKALTSQVCYKSKYLKEDFGGISDFSIENGLKLTLSSWGKVGGG